MYFVLVDDRVQFSTRDMNMLEKYSNYLLALLDDEKRFAILIVPEEDDENE